MYDEFTLFFDHPQTHVHAVCEY